MKIAETERLVLREIDETDAAFVLDLLNQPSFIKYIGDRRVRTVDEARDFVESRYRASYRRHGYGLYAVALKNDGSREIRTPAGEELIGICGFVKRDSLPEPDIGFAFLPQYEGRGYAFESAAAVMRYGREKLGFERVLAITTLDNESSGRLLGKLGFEFTEVIEQDAEKLKLYRFENFD